MGTYSAELAAIFPSSCINCPAGYYSSTAGSTACTNCPVGTYSTIAGGASSCTNCPKGTYSTQEAAAFPSTCINCIAGTYSTTEGAASAMTCINCPAGTYSSTSGAASSSTCINCPKGTYSTQVAAIFSSTCINCPSGTTSGTGATTCDAIIPIEMMDFIAKVDKNIVRLKWITAQEVNTSFYVLQKSTDLNEWITIARTNGHGTYYKTSVYDAVDPFPVKGVTYYRIKEVDFDGKLHHSNILAVEMNENTHLKVYPNPVGSEINIAHGEEIIKSVAVYNIVGQLVMNVSFEKTNIGKIDMSALQQGQYNLHIYTDRGFYSERIFKLR